MHHQSGFSLLEVLIAWFLLSVVLLGLFEIQILSLCNNRHAYLLSIATVQVASMLDRLTVNQTSASRAREARVWNQQNKSLLPDGKGSYQCQPYQCVVRLQWFERKWRHIEMRSLA